MQFSSSSYPPDRSSLKVTHNLGKGLNYEVLPMHQNTWTWMVKFRVRTKDLSISNGYVRGLIHVRVEGHQAMSAEIPLIGRVKSCPVAKASVASCFLALVFSFSLGARQAHSGGHPDNSSSGNLSVVRSR